MYSLKETKINNSDGKKNLALLQCNGGKILNKQNRENS